jgi:hypothetical protein
MGAKYLFEFERFRPFERAAIKTRDANESWIQARARDQDPRPPVVDSELDRGGSMQAEVPVGVPDATEPHSEPPDVEIPSPAHTRAPSCEGTDFLSDDMATVV